MSDYIVDGHLISAATPEDALDEVRRLYNHEAQNVWLMGGLTATEPCAWSYYGTEEVDDGQFLYWWYCEHGKEEMGDEDAPPLWPCELSE